MSKKAIAYASDIILGRTGEVISREYQKELIRQYAADNNIEIVGWFEDEMYNEDVMSRPGVQAMLKFDKEYDSALVERVWCLSRNWNVLETFFKEVERKGKKVEAATTMWDCVSQMARRRFDEALNGARPQRELVTAEEAGTVKVAKPAKLFFANLKANG